MANRFNQFVRTDYIGLPVDYYQAALGAKEQENQQKVADTRQVIDYADNVEAAYNPDKELKSKLLADLDSKIAEVANKNLKGADVLMQLNKIVNDRGLVNDLVGIQHNTVNYRKFLEEKNKYKETYGNDINIDPHEQAITEYNKLGVDGFRSGFLQDSSINKFIDMNGEIQKVIEKMKPQSTEKVSSDGRMIYKVGNKELTMEQLTKEAMNQIRDPKFASQLQLTSNYQLRQMGGGDVNVGAQRYQSAVLENMDSNIAQYKSLLPQYKKDSKQYKEIKQALDNTIKDRSDIEGLKGDRLRNYVYRSGVQDMAAMAAGPFVQKDHTEDMKADPFAMIRLRSALSLHNARTLANEDRQWEMTQQQIEEMKRNPKPTITPFTYKVNGEDKIAPTAFFTKQGGYDMDALVQNVSAIAKAAPRIMLADGGTTNANKLTVGSGKDVKSLQQQVADGSAQIGYMPKEGEYVVTNANGTFRLKADLATQTAMEPLKLLFTTENSNRPVKTQLSFNGKNLSPAIIQNNVNENTGEVQNTVFTPLTDQEFDVNTLTKEQFNTLTGINFGSDVVRNANGWPGIYVTFEGYNGGFVNQDGSQSPGLMAERGFVPFDEYKKKAKGMKEVKNVHFFMHENGKIKPVQLVPGMDGNYNFVESHFQYNTQTDKPLGFTRSKDANKITKSKQTNSSGASTSDEDSESYYSPSY